MKKITAIFFLSVYLFSTTEAYQLLKLPVVFQHFNEHKKESASITFLQFLDMHYMHGSPKDADYERDMQLPFKTTDGLISAMITNAFIPLQVEFVMLKPVELVQKITIIPQDKFILSLYSCNIWQPPKIS